MDLLQLVRGCTFDDFLFAPQCGVLPSRDPDLVDLSTSFSEHLTLSRPLVAANMDTITRAAMAVVLAEEGGLGVIDRGFRTGDIQPQVAEVAAVKRTQHGVITDPHAIEEDRRAADALRIMERTGVGTLAVVDGARRLTRTNEAVAMGPQPHGAAPAPDAAPEDVITKVTPSVGLVQLQRITAPPATSKSPASM